MPQNGSQSTVTTAEAAELLDVSSATLKRWADAGLVESERTAGGHRRFSREVLERFAARYTVAGDAVARWANALENPSTPVESQSLLLAARAERGCWWEVGHALKSVAVELHRRRDKGTVTTVQWLAAFEVLSRGIVSLLAQQPVEAQGPDLLVVSAPQDRLQGFLRIVQLCATSTGWRSRWAGGATGAEVGEELRRHRPDALMLCASLGSDPEIVRSFAAEVSAVADGVPVGAFGFGAWPDPFVGGSRLKSFDEGRAWLADVSRRVGNPRSACCQRHAAESVARSP